ncbi:MAG: ABC transporter permease subunit [Fuerstiella sp.]|jgi:ABC-type transport system involved in multi-copper enzyme maturation permease subunit
MKGLLRKIFLEVRWPVLFLGIGLALIMALLTGLLPKVLGDIDKVFEKLPFIKPLITALLGMDPGEAFTAQMMQAFLWVHPTVLSLLWAHELMYCSRMPAGEIDRGSVDFLLGLPVSRWKLYLTETIGWILSGLFILSVGFSGHWLASSTLEPNMRPGAFATFGVMANLMAVYLAVGGLAFLVSCSSDRRGRAVGIMFAILLMSFLLNFVAQFWDPAKTVSFLSVMQYYRPAIVIQSGQFPVTDVGILLGVAFVFWIAGGVIFRRRSICTV